MPFSTLFFDLDDTLYPSSSGLWAAIRERMARYMWERLNLPREDVPRLRKTYFETYGTTLRGLQLHHGVNADEYLAYVHDLPLAEFIKPDPQVRALLLNLPQPKWIFTNADDQHALRVLKELELAGIFRGIIDIHTLDFACKPEVEAYKQALILAGESDPKRCVMLDDSPRNLAPAKELGFYTILVGSNQPDPAADLSIRCLMDLGTIMPELWRH